MLTSYKDRGEFIPHLIEAQLGDRPGRSGSARKLEDLHINDLSSIYEGDI